jgi:hypothetical protein
MAMGCLAALFGIGVRPNGAKPTSAPDHIDSSGMSEGDIHSGPDGYEGMSYSGGYAADYFDDFDESEEH